MDFRGWEGEVHQNQFCSDAQIYKFVVSFCITMINLRPCGCDGNSSTLLPNEFG